MAKRGRPRKPKIEMPKNHVGRPNAKTRHDIIQLWILATEIEVSRKVKLKEIERVCHISKKTIERIITAFYKEVERKKLIIYADPKTAIVIIYEPASELSQAIGLILPKPTPEFINIDDF